MEVRTPYYPYYLVLEYGTFRTAKKAGVFHHQLTSRLSTIKHVINWAKIIKRNSEPLDSYALGIQQAIWNEEFIEYVKQRYIP